MILNSIILVLPSHDRCTKKSVIFDPPICHGLNGIKQLSHTHALPPKSLIFAISSFFHHHRRSRRDSRFLTPDCLSKLRTRPSLPRILNIRFNHILRRLFHSPLFTTST